MDSFGRPSAELDPHLGDSELESSADKVDNGIARPIGNIENEQPLRETNISQRSVISRHRDAVNGSKAEGGQQAQHGRPSGETIRPEWKPQFKSRPLLPL